MIQPLFLLSHISSQVVTHPRQVLGQFERGSSSKFIFLAECPCATIPPILPAAPQKNAAPVGAMDGEMATANSPWEHPEPRGLAVVQGLLRVIVAVQCWGAAAQQLQAKSTSDLAQALFAGLGELSPVPVQFDRISGVVLLAAGLLTLVRPAALAVLAIVAWFAAQLLSTATGNATSTAFSVSEQLVRVGAPFALALIDWWPPKLAFSLGRFLFALGLLKLTLCLSLGGQALRALVSIPDRPQFTALVEKAASKLPGEPWSPLRLDMAVGVLGGIDLAVAICLLVTRSRAVAIGGALWIAFRTTLWTIALGPDGYAETLIRAGLVGSPLVLAAFSILAVRESKPQILPASSSGK